MRLPVSTDPLGTKQRRLHRSALGLLCIAAAAAWSFPQMIAQDPPMPIHTRLHDSEQWNQIAPHLPDPTTASAKTLEEQADILRARRFPEDAMDYYRYAMNRGGSQAKLLNKLGLAELELKNIQLARVYFQRVVKMDKQNAEGWNNLGAVEFVDGKKSTAVSDYKRAIKLNKREAVFHANLANAYFETRDFRGARREIAAALELNPRIFEDQGTGGIAAHVLSSEDRARFSFEMAKMYARSDMIEPMLHSLSVAAEAGMDIRQEMEHDPVLAKFQMDQRVLVIVHNAQLLRAERPATVSAASGTSSAKPMME
ncbi:MAG TPA: tetratricopeptide repeat protein [Acidobacteriaceae bacterium]|jgi:tetratricopeptide (TPR) repeat protein